MVDIMLKDGLGGIIATGDHFVLIIKGKMSPRYHVSEIPAVLESLREHKKVG